MESIDLTNARPTARTGSRSKNSSGETGGAAPPDLLPEQLLASLWQKRAARQQRFKTNGGRQVRVLYPGRPSSSAGPDFRDAVFHLEGLGLVRGAVEIHRRQQDWDSHGHGRDPNFNGVVLHVALEVAGGDTRLQSGQQVPVISLASLLDSTGTATDSPTGTPAGDAIRSDAGPGEAFSLWALLQEKGYPRPPDGEGMVGLLDRAGDARFRQKSARYQAFLREPDQTLPDQTLPDQTLPDQTLYEGICEALGYRRNQQPFLKLAQRSPYRALAQAAGQLPQEQRAGALEAWLLKLSGLAEPPGIKLPRRGWVPSLLTSALAANKSAAGGRSLIGSGRARDLAVNVVLPFFDALGVVRGEGNPAPGQPYPQCYFENYRRFGLLQDNELLREMRERLFSPVWQVPIDSARRQQGLLHLHHLLRGGG